MNNRKLKQLNMLVILIIISGCICAFVFGIYFKPEKVNKINNESMKKYNEGWVLKQYDEPDEILNLPCKVSADAEEIVLIMNRVPEDVNSSTVLMFKTEFQNVIVMVGGEQVYSNGVLNNQKMMKNAVPCYNIAEIGTAKPGDIISIYLVSGYKSYSGKIPEIYYGTKGDVVSDIVRKNGISFVLAAIIVLITILLVVSLAFLHREALDKRRAFYAFAFVICSALWLMFNNPIMQLITSNLFGVYMTGMILLLLLPIVYTMYQRCLINKKRYGFLFEIMIYFFGVNFLTGVVFQFLNVIDFARYILITKSLICIGLLVMTCIMYLGEGKNFVTNLMLTATCALEAIMSLFKFYKPYDGVIIEAGLFVFICMMVISTEKVVIEEVDKKNEDVKSGVELEKNIILKKINSNLIYSSMNTVINNLKPRDIENSRLVYDTSIYMKHNLDVITNKGKVDFYKELEYIKSYLGIMKGQNKDLIISVEDKVVEFFVPYNTIEPLVENAIVNGALRSEGEKKFVFRSYERLDCYAIQIVDNGPGISPEKRFYGKEDFASIKKRLKKMSGATVDVKSKPDRGTIMTIKIPKDGYIIKE